MKNRKAHIGCQCQKQCLDRMWNPDTGVILPPSDIRLKLSLTRRMNPRLKRTVLGHSDQIMSWFSRLAGRRKKVSTSSEVVRTVNLKAGDLVRVRSKEEIEATLNFWRQLKGCKFMEEMETYCGTTQRVLKPVERFLDERDHQLKKAKGLVLLEGAMCQGIKKFGPCDRSCFYFWRKEWLEKIE